MHLREGQHKIQLVRPPDFSAVLMPDTIDGKIGSGLLDQRINLPCLGIVGDSPVGAVKLYFHVKRIIGHGEISLGQAPKREPIPTPVGPFDPVHGLRDRSADAGGFQCDTPVGDIAGVTEVAKLGRAVDLVSDRLLTRMLTKVRIADQILLIV